MKKFVQISSAVSVANAEINDLSHLLETEMSKYCVNTAHRSSDCMKWTSITDNHGGYADKVITQGKTEDLQYTVEDKITKPSLTLSQEFNNTLPAAATMHFKQGQAVSSTCSWSLTAGIKSTSTISEKVGIPDLEETTFTESIELSLSTTVGGSTTHTQTWEIDDDIPVPANTYVEATYTVKEDDLTADWSAKVHFCGCVQTWFKDGYKWPGGDETHNLWFPWAPVIYGNLKGFTCSYKEGSDYNMVNHPPVAHADEDGKFLKEQVPNTVCSDACCIYEATGQYKGIAGAKSFVTTKHKPAIGGENVEPTVEIKQLTGQGKEVFNSLIRSELEKSFMNTLIQ